MEERDEQAFRDIPKADDPWRLSEKVRRRRLREDGERSLAVNLAEGLALIDYLSKFTGAARGR
jgi:hypothetical protein